MDHYYLNLAYQLALQNSGNTSPNPSVGAVVVRENAMVGRAYHPKAGEPHAEVIALDRAGEKAKGATLYCSLEPCSHHGKTPPCTDRILSSGVARVVYGAADQNPAVNGAEILTRQGLKVDHLPQSSIDRFYAPFFQTIAARRPYVVAKIGMTCNGIISPADRNSRWITNETSLSWVHQLRARCDAILVGADTIILDRPHLTVRAEGLPRNPVRIVVDQRFKLDPEDCSLLEDKAPILICGSHIAPVDKEKIWKDYGVRTLRFKDLVSLLRQILDEGINTILMEGGQKIFTLFHTAGLIDEYNLILAPRLLTGRFFLNMLGGPEQSLTDSERFHMDSPLELDGDVVIRMRPKNPRCLI